VTKAPSKPIWEQTDRRIQMEIKKTDSKPMQELLRRTTFWYESFPPPPVPPLSWEDRNSRLEALQEGLLKVVEETLLKKKKKPSPGRFFYGDFPVPLQLLKIHLHTLVGLKKILDVPLSYHSYNPDGRVKCPRLRRYLKTLSSWRDHAPAMHASMSEEDQILNPLDGDTSRGPDFWFKVRNIDKMQDLLRLDIRHLEKRAKGTVRSMCSAFIRAHVKKRQERLTTGRMRAALASLLGKYKNVFLYDTLQCEDGSFDADPIVIHRTLQRYYMKYLSVVPESSLQTLALDLPLWGSIPIWETFLDNADTMVEAYCRPPNELPPTRIPEIYVRAIAEAFVWTPEAITLEAEITESYRTRFFFDEFLYSLGCGGASAQGGSGASYRLFQVAPEAVLHEIFELLQEFWEALLGRETPDQWKNVLLILIQKNSSKPAGLGNFRPIGLIEVLRKVWTKMVTRRLLPLLEKHKVLQTNQFAFFSGRGTTSELIQLLNVLEEIQESNKIAAARRDPGGRVDRM
jgi:hypothetical protein